ncbi:hypothetical protein BYT27DRAFT_7247408 [Phlegmacium glaucopus]|nr:hypothetical protein BYT27DRAFT_7247408 [Phlegmacium glaucopus]
MALLPFNLSYIVLTPRRVRLPGELSPQSPATPEKRTSMRWSSADISSKARSLRAKLSPPRAATTMGSIKSMYNYIVIRESPAQPLIYLVKVSVICQT